MKYGVNTMVWTTRVDASRAPLFRRIREWGFDGAELFLSPNEPEDLPAVRKLLEAESTGVHHVQRHTPRVSLGER